MRFVNWDTFGQLFTKISSRGFAIALRSVPAAVAIFGLFAMQLTCPLPGIPLCAVLCRRATTLETLFHTPEKMSMLFHATCQSSRSKSAINDTLSLSKAVVTRCREKFNYKERRKCNMKNVEKCFQTQTSKSPPLMLQCPRIDPTYRHVVARA